MMNILQLNTGLFPDAVTVANAIASREGKDQVTNLDVSSLKPDDTEAWDAVAAAIARADMVVSV